MKQNRFFVFLRAWDLQRICIRRFLNMRTMRRSQQRSDWCNGRLRKFEKAKSMRRVQHYLNPAESLLEKSVAQLKRFSDRLYREEGCVGRSAWYVVLQINYFIMLRFTNYVLPIVDKQ